MDEQERDLEQLLARANRLLQQYSVVDQCPGSSRLEELQSLRDGLDTELKRYRVRCFLETLKA